MMKPLIEMKNVSKSFPGVKALQQVNLRAFAGEVMALLGENGAGKSTLMKILSGVYKRDEGQLFIEGQQVELSGIKDAGEKGISIIHQELSVLLNLKVYENIFLGCETVSGMGRLNKKDMIKKAGELLKEIGSDIDPTAYVGSLTVGERQMVEIVKAISKNAKVIIMDEPTTALTDNEVNHLFKVIETLKKQKIGIIYISHRLEEIFTMCDRVTVLRDGCYIGEEAVSGLDKNKLIAMMVGRTLEEQYPYLQVTPGEMMLEVKHLSMGERVKDISFFVRQGEIMGVAGLMGAGRTEVAKIIFGEYKATSGEILVEGKPVQIHSPKHAFEHGIAYLSEDRKGEGLILSMSVLHNMTLSNLSSYENRFKKINKSQENKDYNHFVDKLSVKTPSGEQLIKNLSGGNQQKVILAKLIMLAPKVLIIDEPTRGIDVGAKKEIYEILNELKKAGKAIIMISSDLEEVLGISDRIIVLHEGRLTGHVSREEASQEVIMKYAVDLNGKGGGEKT